MIFSGLESEVSFPNPKDLGVAGRETRKRKRLFTQTGVEYVVGVGKLFLGFARNGWSVHSRIFMKRVECGELICEAGTTFLSEY